jgi:hypothetical protein
MLLSGGEESEFSTDASKPISAVIFSRNDETEPSSMPVAIQRNKKSRGNRTWAMFGCPGLLENEAIGD